MKKIQHVINNNITIIIISGSVDLVYTQHILYHGATLPATKTRGTFYIPFSIQSLCDPGCLSHTQHVSTQIGRTAGPLQCGACGHHSAPVKGPVTVPATLPMPPKVPVLCQRAHVRMLRRPLQVGGAWV